MKRNSRRSTNPSRHLQPVAVARLADEAGWTSAGLRVENVPIGALVPSPRNARSHSAANIQQIRASLRTFGFVNPLLADANGNVIAGHGRLKAAKDEGMTTVPVLRVEHLSADQLRAYALADNRLAEKSGWDKSILAIELQHLLEVDCGLDVTVTGFEVAEIDLLIEQAKATPAEPDEVELDGTGPRVCRPGDLWNLGRHRLLCGNALEEESYRRLMQGSLARVAFTDPPYNVPIDGHASGLGKIRHREFVMAAGEMTDDEFIAFLERVCRNLVNHSTPGSLHYLFQDWRHAYHLLSAARTNYRELKAMCVWHKTTPAMGSFYRNQHELVLVFKNGVGPHHNNIRLGKFGRNRTNVWSYPSVNAFARESDEGRLAELHPTVKPVALVADALLDASARGDIVLDPFLGSGTTLIAAERIGRTCFGMELDALYVDVAIRRWQRHTGDHAVHATTGKRFDQLESNRGKSHGR